MRLLLTIGLAAVCCAPALAGEQAEKDGCITTESLVVSKALPVSEHFTQELDLNISHMVPFKPFTGADVHFVMGGRAVVRSVANKLELTDRQRELLAAWEADHTQLRPRYSGLASGKDNSSVGNLLDLLELQASHLQERLARVEAEQRLVTDFINSLTEEQRRELQAKEPLP